MPLNRGFSDGTNLSHYFARCVTIVSNVSKYAAISDAESHSPVSFKQAFTSAISSVSSLIDDTCGSSSEVNDLPIVTGDEILLRPRLVCADCVLLRVLACRRISLSGVVPTAARLLLVLRSGGVRERSITLSV